MVQVIDEDTLMREIDPSLYADEKEEKREEKEQGPRKKQKEPEKEPRKKVRIRKKSIVDSQGKDQRKKRPTLTK